ncbi:restriction endonuclease subunit S [Martelella alba]|nr:restriction endonuclease subunit S [Martelella alba]
MVHDGSYSQLELMQARVKSVPDGWAFNYVGKAFAIKNNLRKPISEDERDKNPGRYPYYGPTKIQGYIGTFEQDGSYALIGEDGDHFLKYESQAMTQLVDGKCTVNNHAHVIEGTKKATREWFYYYFMHRDIFSFLSRQGAGRYKLNKASLEKIPVLVPPVQEQKKITQILSTWDKAITTTEQLLTNSQQQKKALMQQLLTGKKRLLDKNGGRFSGEWRFLTFDEAFKVANKKSAQVKSSDYLATGSVAIVDQGKELIAGYCDNDERYTNVPVIIFGDHTRCLKWVDFEFCPGADGTQVLDTKEFLDKKFGYYLLCHTDIPNLGYSRHMRELKEKDFKVPVDMVEQQKIAAVLSAADQEISALQQNLEALKQEKKALMQQLLTGKRRVTVEEAA